MVSMRIYHIYHMTCESVSGYVNHARFFDIVLKKMGSSLPYIRIMVIKET